jgi:hypothetical protein
MALKELSDLASRLATGATIALATASLTTCNKDGAVDPAPPPTDCSQPSTTMLDAYGYLMSGDLNVTVSIRSGGYARFSGTQVQDPMGLTIVDAPASSTGSIQLKLRPNPPGTTTGSFRLTSTITDDKGATCGVDKTFTFSIMSGNVQITSRHISSLPLDVRYPASIALSRHEGSVLELKARSGYAGAKHVEWTVSDGVIESQAGDELRWRLPDAPGLYQVELVIDYGEGGFAIDHMTFEVSAH